MSVQVESLPGAGNRRHRNKMGVKRKRVSPPESQQGGAGGLYVHSSPPRVIQMNPSIIRQWLRTGDLDKLEAVVLEGQGHKLVGEYSPDPKVRAYLKTLPAFLAKMEMAHEAVNKGRLEDLKTLLGEDRRGRLALCKDSAGVPLLHKAVFLGHEDIMSCLVENHPETATLKDKEGRTALHYVGALSDPFKGWELIEPAGADPACTDTQGHTASYYMEHPEEIHLPESRRAGNSSNFRRFTSGKDGLVVTRANIRIWIHDRDLGRLQQMLWEGHGGKLRVETSNNPRVKRFLDAVPYIMGTIKDVHSAVIHDDLELYQKRTADPVPTNILISKDQNGLNPLHKAAGLGREEIVQDILQRNEGALSLTDNEGRTPLHYAAAVRDGGHMYNLLVEAGADENALDNKGKAPSHYRHKPGELDTKLLKVIPEAPRTATRFPPAWDWRLLNNMTYDFGPISTDNASTPPVEGSSARAKIQKTNANMTVAATAATAATAAVAATAVAAAGGLPSRQETPIPGNKLAEDAPDVAAPMEDEEEDEGVGEEGDHEEDEREDIVMPDVEQQQEEQEEEKEEEGEEREEGEKEEEKEEEEQNPEEMPQEEPKEETEEQEEEEQEGEEAEEEQVDRWEREPSEEDQDSGAGAEPESTEQEQDEEVAQLVEEGNMEQLANLVLDGQGERLIGVTSTDPELQSFLNNVPAYMAKIRTVHEAAREGRLRDLQAALDRRKFAIAKDSETPLGATPLHLAVLFGHTPIVRYLAGRFPETMSARDSASERTPLHYAAALDDNGHYYNLLVSLGANTELLDEFGNTAEYYMQNPGLLTKKRLLKKFGIEEGTVPNENLTDQVENDMVSARREVDQSEILETLERCYEVIHEGTDSSDHQHLLLKTHLRRPVFDSLKTRLTRNDHSLLDVIWPGAKEMPEDTSKDTLDEELEDIIYGNGGVLAPDYESYFVFAELLVPIIKDLHGLTAGYDINIQPKTTFFLKNEIDEEENNAKTIGEVNVDPSGKKVDAGVMECTRNLAQYQLPSNLSLASLEIAEREITALLEKTEDRIGEKEDDEEQKNYYSVAEVLEENSEIKNKLESECLLLPVRDDDGEVEDENLLHGSHWPRGRGVFLARGGGLAVWVNVLEHIRVIVSTPRDTPGDLGVAYDRLANFMTALDEEGKDRFRYDPILGYLTARPSCLGNTLNLMLDIHLPQLARDQEALYKLCSARGLIIHRRKVDKENVFLISNQQSLSITEHQTLRNFASAVANIVHLETAGESSSSPLQTGSHETTSDHLPPPVFWTEEGQYLANTLGEPLVKGLTEVANRRPTDPIAYLATYLYNFANSNSQTETVIQESPKMITSGPGKMADTFAPPLVRKPTEQELNEILPASESPEVALTGFNRDEHGQSMLHFAANRSQGRNALFQLLQESDINVGYRDELYRTARDVAIQSNLPENIQEIDKWVLYLGARGETNKLMEFLLEGYDHIVDVEDEEDNHILDVVAKRQLHDTLGFLQQIPLFEERREQLHNAIRKGNIEEVKNLLRPDDEKQNIMAIAKNQYSRCCLHIAVLSQDEEIVEYIVSNFPETLRVGDNLERTPLHYAMGTEKVELLSNILIKGGAKRVLKDLKGRQPSYYFMNKTDILRLQEDEEALKM